MGSTGCYRKIFGPNNEQHCLLPWELGVPPSSAASAAKIPKTVSGWTKEEQQRLLCCLQRSLRLFSALWQLRHTHPCLHKGGTCWFCFHNFMLKEIKFYIF